MEVFYHSFLVQIDEVGDELGDSYTDFFVAPESVYDGREGVIDSFLKYEVDQLTGGLLYVKIETHRLELLDKLVPPSGMKLKADAAHCLNLLCKVPVSMLYHTLHKIARDGIMGIYNVEVI